MSLISLLSCAVNSRIKAGFKIQLYCKVSVFTTSLSLKRPVDMSLRTVCSTYAYCTGLFLVSLIYVYNLHYLQALIEQFSWSLTCKISYQPFSHVELIEGRLTTWPCKRPSTNRQHRVGLQ